MCQELELPISRTGSLSQSTTSTTTSSPQSPTTFKPSLQDMYNNSHNRHHLHRVHYLSHWQKNEMNKSTSGGSKDEAEPVEEEVWVQREDVSEKSDQGLLDTTKMNSVELKDYSYVIFARNSQHEYSYPYLETTEKPPLKREAICNKKHTSIVVQPKPPLPMKSKKTVKHYTKHASGPLLVKAQCKHCHETFTHENNHRGSCEEAPDSVETCIEILTCVSCAKGIMYHCMSDPDGEFGHPCICDFSDNSNCKKWTVLSVLSMFVPCLWCYWPFKACHMCGVSLGCCGGRHKAT